MPPITVRSITSPNTLFYGDNLPILRDYVDDESVDLVYLDPPFNSNRSYNVLFRDDAAARLRRKSPRSRTPGIGTRQPSGSTRRW